MIMKKTLLTILCLAIAMIGAKANEVRTAIEEKISSAGERIKSREIERRLAAEKIDVDENGKITGLF